jgi:hypothetical protein
MPEFPMGCVDGERALYCRFAERRQNWLGDAALIADIRQIIIRIQACATYDFAEMGAGDARQRFEVGRNIHDPAPFAKCKECKMR